MLGDFNTKGEHRSESERGTPEQSGADATRRFGLKSRSDTASDAAWCGMVSGMVSGFRIDLLPIHNSRTVA